MTPPKKDKPDIFDYLNAIFYKYDIKYDSKTAPAYLLSMWLSYDNSLLPIINKINKYHFMLKDNIIYKYYFDKISKGKRYIKWVKKDEKDEKLTKKITAFREDTGLSKKEANIFLTFIKKDDIIEKKSKSGKNIFFD